MLKTRTLAVLGIGLVGLACSFAAPGCGGGSDASDSKAAPANEAQQNQYKARAAAAAKEGPPKAAHSR